MKLEPLDPDDSVAVDDAYQILTASVAHDVPDFPVMTHGEYRAQLRYPWPGDLTSRWIARREGAPAGVLAVRRPILDNLHLANVEITVHPTLRRRGVGRDLFGAAVEFARANGRRTLQGDYVVALPGGPPRSAAHQAFAEATGVKSALSEVRRRLDLATADPGPWPTLLDQARAKAAGYSIVAWRDVAPDDVVEGIAALDSRFVAEAPIGDLELEPERVDVKRVRAAEQTVAKRGGRNYHVVARHDATGTVVAWTNIRFEGETVDHAWQQITIVDPAHRGHRLGLLVKLENLRRTVQSEPRLRHIHTWNGNENTHMIAINESIGYRAVDAWVNWQLHL